MGENDLGVALELLSRECCICATRGSKLYKQRETGRLYCREHWPKETPSRLAEMGDSA
jgi:recombinational DNA repair protein (RecF pathway)